MAMEVMLSKVYLMGLLPLLPMDGAPWLQQWWARRNSRQCGQAMTGDPLLALLLTGACTAY